MRIALVTHFYPSHGGGIELVAGRLALELAGRYGWQIDWYASEGDVLPQLPGVTAIPMSAWNAVERLSGLPYPLWSPRALGTLARGIAGADAVHVHEFAYAGSLSAVRAAHRAAVPLILTQHIGVVRTRYRALGALYRLLEACCAQWCFDRSAAVAFVSETTRAHFQDRRGTRSQYLTLWNGVDTQILQLAGNETRAAARSDWGLGAAGPVVLFAGRRVAKKGIRIVESVARALPGVQFLVAGQGPEDPHSWGLPNVRALGFVAPELMPSLYQAADLLLLPSYFEGFPLVVQEALACGMAVLTTDEVASACPPVASLVHACAVPTTGDPSPWIDALAATLPAARDDDARALRAAAAARLWSWEHCADRYAGLFRAASAGNAPSPQRSPS